MRLVSNQTIKTLQKNISEEKFELVPFIDQSKTNDPAYLKEIKNDLFNNLPFYEGLLFNKKSGSIRSAIYLDKDIVNTPIRRDFVIEKLIPAIENFEKEAKIDLRVSGMPYIRTLNAQTILGEISIFIGASLLVTSLLFFFFFRRYCFFIFFWIT